MSLQVGVELGGTEDVGLGAVGSFALKTKDVWVLAADSFGL